MAALIMFVTSSSVREANRLARTLVEERLAACVSIVPAIISHYRWEGKHKKGSELLLLIKTTTARYRALERRVKALHSYAVPEIVAVRIARGSAQYLKWLENAVR